MLRTTMISIGMMVLFSIALFQYYERRLSGIWLDLAIHPDVNEVLTLSAEDQKQLSRFDPDRREFYRERFERVQRLRNNLAVLGHNREELQSHFEYALWSLFGVIMLATLTLHMLSQRLTGRRIEALQEPLSDLAGGQCEVQVRDRGKDTIGQIGRMIERTADVMARRNEQLRYLEHLSAWQEAARRHAHEIRTPLTAAQMELETLAEIRSALSPELEQRLDRGIDSVLEELECLKRFTQDFTAFARVREPNLKEDDLNRMLRHFLELFARAWDNLSLEQGTIPETPSTVRIDREMIRQVLMNLCQNSSLAMEQGTVRFSITTDDKAFSLTVADNGPGIDPNLADRLFAPYASSRPPGSGMGLGLAISRKIMLDHGGDLELAASSEAGATFRLTLPIAGDAPKGDAP